MENNDLEFVISGYVSGISGKHTYIGRCGDKAICLGDTFETAFRAKLRAYPDELANPLVREVECPVKLRVEHIQAYGRCLQMLGEGMTGALELSGPEAEKFGEGWTLITASNPKSVSPSDFLGTLPRECQTA